MPPSAWPADAVEVDVGGINDAVGGQQLAAGEDGVGDLLRRRAAVAGVVLDAEVAVGPAGVVAGGKDQAAEGRYLRITQEAAGVDRMPPCPTSTRATPIGGGHAQDHLDRLRDCR
jgi:hypothetical protein